jgi:hypothetical protein
MLVEAHLQRKKCNSYSLNLRHDDAVSEDAQEFKTSEEDVDEIDKVQPQNMKLNMLREMPNASAEFTDDGNDNVADIETFLSKLVFDQQDAIDSFKVWPAHALADLPVPPLLNKRRRPPSPEEKPNQRRQMSQRHSDDASNIRLWQGTLTKGQRLQVSGLGTLHVVGEEVPQLMEWKSNRIAEFGKKVGKMLFKEAGSGHSEAIDEKVTTGKVIQVCVV